MKKNFLYITKENTSVCYSLNNKNIHTEDLSILYSFIVMNYKHCNYPPETTISLLSYRAVLVINHLNYLNDCGTFYNNNFIDLSYLESKISPDDLIKILKSKHKDNIHSKNLNKNFNIEYIEKEYPHYLI